VRSAGAIRTHNTQALGERIERLVQDFHAHAAAIELGSAYAKGDEIFVDQATAHDHAVVYFDTN
jgi:hypothetical protein